MLHGAVLQSSGRPRVAVIVEPAHPARISPLLMAAYALSDREQQVARLVLNGAATADIARSLHISPHIVQQHFKAIFEKTGVRSRRDLVAKILFTLQAATPRQRTTRARPLPNTRRACHPPDLKCVTVDLRDAAKDVGPPPRTQPGYKQRRVAGPRQSWRRGVADLVGDRVRLHRSYDS